MRITIRNFLRLCLVILMLFSLNSLTSCKSRQSICEANSQYKPKKIKKNKSNYGTKFGFQSKPTRKNYVIRNR
jgi:hypothetical protein